MGAEFLEYICFSKYHFHKKTINGKLCVMYVCTYEHVFTLILINIFGIAKQKLFKLG